MNRFERASGQEFVAWLAVICFALAFLVIALVLRARGEELPLIAVLAPIFMVGGAIGRIKSWIPGGPGGAGGGTDATNETSLSSGVSLTDGGTGPWGDYPAFPVTCDEPFFGGTSRVDTRY